MIDDSTEPCSSKATPDPDAEIKSRQSSPVIRRVADQFRSVADPTRLRMLMLLVDKDRSVSELIGKTFSDSHVTTSRHLSLLRQVGMVDSRAMGASRIYSLTSAGRILVDTIMTIREVQGVRL